MKPLNPWFIDDTILTVPIYGDEPRTLKFDPGQPRDESGKWSDTGGGGGSVVDDDYEHEHLASPSDALISLHNEEHVTIAAEDLRRVLDKAAKSEVPIDLTNLAIEGRPIFAGGLNRKRITMPQIPREHQEAFLADLKKQGIDVVHEKVRPSLLLPTQNEIDARRVGQMLHKHDFEKKILREIMVSKDSYTLDGHHRWAVGAAFDVEHPKDKFKMPIIRIMVPHERALKLMEEFTHKRGIAVEALAAHPSDDEWMPDDEFD